jgi:ABC-2 type transport system permease protein
VKLPHINLEWRFGALKNGWQDAMAYRWEYLFEVLGSLFVPVSIQLLLWYAIFKVGGASEVAGMNYTQMVTYTAMSALFSQVRGGNHDFDLAEMIRSGTLSTYLLKPMSVVEFIYIRGISPKLLVAIFSYLVGCLASPWLGTNPALLTLAMVLALVGNLIHYQVGALLVSASFYWEEAYSLLMVKNMLVSFLSGELIPLTLIPEQYSWIWKSFPFYLYVHGPIQIAQGHWGLNDVAYHFAISIAWMFGLGFTIRLIWGIAIRRYTSIGG